MNMPLGLEKRHARRARALEAARRIVGRYGYTEATMKRIADDCGLATKTLYNQFGSKDHLVAAAIEELMVGVIEGAQARSPEGGLAGLLALEERTILFFERGPDLGKHMLTAFRRSGQASPLRSRLDHLRTDFVNRCLQQMRSSGDLAAWATPAGVASVLSAQHHGLIDLWLGDIVETSDLRRQALLGTCVVLYGFTQESTQSYLRILISTYVDPSAEGIAEAPVLRNGLAQKE